MQPQQVAGIISFGAGSQLGDVTIGEAAGRDLIKTYNTIIAPAVPPSIVRHSAPSQPPRALRGFRDRDSERRQLLHELRPRGGAWLSGPGGAGASALLRQVANATTADLPDGVAYLDRSMALLVEGGPGDGTASGLDDIAQLLFERFFRSSDPARRIRVDLTRATAYLGGLRALFIFDHLPLGRAQLDLLIDALAGGSVLVAAPGPPAEALLDLPLAGLPRQDAADLLAAGAGLDPAEASAAPHITALCAALDNLPLGLQLVAALLRAGEAPLERIAAAAGYPDEPSPLGRALRLALEALGADERALLAACATGEPDLAEEAILDISGLTPARAGAALTRLGALRLVTGGEGRYGIASLSMRRELARLLDLRGSRRAAAAFFAAAAARPGDLAWAAAEAGNLFSAAAHAAQHGAPGQVGPLARALHPHVVLEGRWDAWGRLAQWAGEAAEREGDASLRAWALHEQGARGLLTGSPAAGLAALEQALALRERLGETAAAELTRRTMAFAAPPAGSPAAGRPWLRLAPLLLALLLAGGAGVAALLAAGPGPTRAPQSATAAGVTAPPAPTVQPTRSVTPGAAPLPAPSAIAAQPSETLAPLLATLAATETSTPTPEATSDSTATALAGRCVVTVPALNLREGPSPDYSSLARLSAGTLVAPLAQAYGGSWLDVTSPAGRGWVFNGASPSTLACGAALAELPLGAIPPTYTPSPTTSPTATATETPSATTTPSATATLSATATPPRRPRPTDEPPATLPPLPPPPLPPATLPPLPPPPLPPATDTPAPSETPVPPTETAVIPG